MEDDEDNEMVAASAVDAGQLDPEQVALFRKTVSELMLNVFNVSMFDVIERVHFFFDQGTVRRPALFAYHLTPLQIAADLSRAGDRALTETELRRYSVVMRKMFAPTAVETAADKQESSGYLAAH